MSSTKIGYMTGEFPRVSDTFIQREVAELRDHGWQVDTFAVRRPQSSERVDATTEEGVRTTYLLPAKPWSLLRAHLRTAARSPLRYLAAAKLAMRIRQPGFKGHLWQFFYFAEAALLADAVRTRGLTHVHNHFGNSSCSVTMLAAEMGGFSFSLTLHGPTIWFEPKHWRVDVKVEKPLFVACISNYCRSQTMMFSAVSEWDRTHVIHCGVDPGKYRKAEHTDSTHRLTFVGRLTVAKGLKVLLEAVRIIADRYPEVELILIGGGSEGPEMEAETMRLGLQEHVRFEGPKVANEVRQYLSATDVFVLSSFAEGVPVVAMEALASAVPVVATRVGGIAELVEDGVSGFLVAPGDPAVLADRVCQLLADPELRSRFGEAGRRRGEAEFDQAKEAARLRTIMAKALAQYRFSAPVGQRNEAPAASSGRTSKKGAATREGPRGAAVTT